MSRIENSVLEKARVLRRAGHFPDEQTFRAQAWLKNFQGEEREVAAVLLDRFVFYPERLTNELLKAAYRSICDVRPRSSATPDALASALESAVFTPVEGEDPHRADSGNLFCRKARQILEIPEDRIVEPAQALSAAASGSMVVFVDDFVGSGNQFLSTWNQSLLARQPSTFSDASALSHFPAVYLHLITTRYGYDRIRSKAPQVTLVPFHILEASDSYRGIPSRNSYGISNLQAKIKQLLSTHANHLAPSGSHFQDLTIRAEGFHRLGLTIAFEHSVPDATLPIFWAPSKNSSWTQLLRRT